MSLLTNPVFLLATATCIGGFIAGFITCAFLTPSAENDAFDRGYDAGMADGLHRRAWRDRQERTP